MDNLILFLIVDLGFLLILVALLFYAISKSRREGRKTEKIKQNLEEERQKTNKFHVSIEEIRRLTK